VVGTRSFGSSPALVARHGAAAVRGLQSRGVAACAKHFPGHGSTAQDSHAELAVVSGGMAEVEARDLPPFRAAIEAGVATVMPGHLQVPGLTGALPASLSGAALGLLRSMGFSGVILTDALEMRAVSDPYGLAGASVRALAAGCDLLCLGRDVGEEGYLESRAAIVEAVRSGALPGDRVEEAAARVSALRSRLAAARDAGGTRMDGDEAGLEAARRALRLTGPRPELRDPVVIEVEPVLNMAAGTAHWGLARWVHPDDVVRLAASPDPQSAAAAAAQAAEGRALLLVVRDAHRSVSIQVTALLARRPDAVVVEMGLPYWAPPAGTFRAYLATYGASRASTQAAVEFLGLAGVPELGPQGGPDLLGGEGHVEVADTARAQRVQHGVHHRGGGAQRAALPHALHAQGVRRRRRGQRMALQLRQRRRERDRVVHQRRRQRLP
jgi:beta-N-acetylhexosaminidase